ncbi:MAG TPA: DUF3341 domain-containing protein [Terracidiphilus sp.]|jgi:hypothetical protein
MSSVQTAVFGLFATAETAEAAFDQLLARGFLRSGISILVPDNETTRVFAQQESSLTDDTTTAGVSTGGIVGGGLGLLAGLGELAVPGIGPLMAAGPITATLVGAAVGGTLGGLVGALIGAGIPEFEAKIYEGAVREGGILLSIHCESSDQVNLAESALEESGAQQVASTCEEISDESLGPENPLPDHRLQERSFLSDTTLG